MKNKLGDGSASCNVSNWRASFSIFWICLRLLGPAGGVSTPSSGLGLSMVKELDLQLALGMNERR